MTSDTLTLGSAHNFGVYMKSGRRTIFQIDFTCKRINVIEKGNIRKKYGFETLEQYDSEDDLHIVIKFRGSKDLEFDADTAEEKYTICRLLGLVEEDLIERSQNNNNTQVLNQQNGGLRQKLSTRKQVIKEAILDKKGNTKIPTWSKRKLQVCPGEFSYFKPGEEIALNLVQLWENSVTISSFGSNGFSVTVRDRTYSFKVLPDKSNYSPDVERDAWIQAFRQASQRKRATFLLLEMSKSDYGAPNARQGVPLPSIPYEEEENEYYNRDAISPMRKDLSQSTDELEDPHTNEALLELDEAIGEVNKRAGNARKQASEDISLSVVTKTSPMSPLPTVNRPRPQCMQDSFKKLGDVAEDNMYEAIPPDYTPPGSPTSGDNSAFSFQGKSRAELQEDRPSGKYATVIRAGSQDDAPKASASPSSGAEPRVSGTYTRVIRTDQEPARRSEEDLSQSKAGNSPRGVRAGAVELPKLSETPKLKKVPSVTRQGSESPRDDATTDKVSVKQAVENIYVNQKQEPVQPKKKAAAPPPVLTSQQSSEQPPAPPPLPPPHVARGGPAPPPPPIDMARKRSRGKMKQVHWLKVPRPLVVESIWKQAADRTPLLNLQLLEEHFSLTEREIQPPTPGVAKGGKQLLVDPKRAQNLGIFMSGLKEGTRRLVDVLNCVVEDDSFPAEKLTTIKRYQPTEDEMDMYKEYYNKPHELLPVDQFMMELCQIPCLSIRIDICLIIWEFPWQYDGTCQLVDQVHAACDELQQSKRLVRVLEYLLAIGNYMNRNWSETGTASGFQISSLDKMLGMRGRETGYTMVHFLVEQLRTSDPDLLSWINDVAMVKKCEQTSVKAVVAESDVLKADLNKVKRHLKTLKAKLKHQTSQDHKFQQDAQNLTVEYEMKLDRLDRRCSELHNKYRKLMTRFGEPMYQRSDDLFAVVANFADKFKVALRDIEQKAERKATSP